MLEREIVNKFYKILVDDGSFRDISQCVIECSLVYFRRLCEKVKVDGGLWPTPEGSGSGREGYFLKICYCLSLKFWCDFITIVGLNAVDEMWVLDKIGFRLCVMPDEVLRTVEYYNINTTTTTSSN